MLGTLNSADMSGSLRAPKPINIPLLHGKKSGNSFSSPSRVSMDKDVFNFHPRIHLPWKLCEPPQVASEPPRQLPFSLVLPEPTIPTMKKAVMPPIKMPNSTTRNHKNSSHLVMVADFASHKTKGLQFEMKQLTFNNLGFDPKNLREMGAIFKNILVKRRRVQHQQQYMTQPPTSARGHHKESKIIRVGRDGKRARAERRSSSVPILESKTHLVAVESISLGDIPEELLYHITECLTNKDKFNMCIASSRIIPQMWGVTLVAYSRSLALVQEECESMGILTEIASTSQIQAQEEWWSCTQEGRMMLEDVRRYDANPARYETDVMELRDIEQKLLAKFQATVGVLKDVMAKWGDVCKHRDDISKMCQVFHVVVSSVFSLSVT